MNILTIDVTEDIDFEDDSSDEDYEPSLNFTLRPNLATDNIPIEDTDESDSDNEIDPSDSIDSDSIGNIRRIAGVDEIDQLTDDRPLLVYQQALLDLANIQVNSSCQVKGCCENITLSTVTVASAIYIKWVCKNGHLAQKWCSQPILNRRLHGGDLLIASAILLSGNNFQKILTMAKFLKLTILSSSTFHRIQITYLVPSIDKFWTDQQDAIIDEFRDQDLIVLGDGRKDSPGHSAQYCSYTFMEYISKKILYIITLDKRSTDKKSTNLEKACFQKGMRFFKDAGLKVVEVVTDAHVQIASLMSKTCIYPEIKHSFDVWHGTKNLGKKLISQEKENKALKGWTKDIVNHYWHCSEVSNTYEEFVDVWYGVLHHVVDEHTWVIPYTSSGDSSCQHGPLVDDREKQFLEKGSSPHTALRKLVMDKRLLNKIPYYLNCRSTAELENFQNLILMYASKRNSYSPPMYRARNRLSALDHNAHIERAVMSNKDGSLRWQRSTTRKLQDGQCML
ncbi:uncharacterized protein LOC125647150 [Ostrea edulis]|uniref:uncharacterized protein LOC125647150 n=1 Tax=Ostrea edulis TaxID=37623 RepID=UPI0024AF7D45|nr:uncharacterized protein LOC125647150 [Ostrea edulis]